MPDDQSPEKPTEEPQAALSERPAQAQTLAGDDAIEVRDLTIGGIHHITAICTNLEQTVAFYRDLLGLTLLKRSHNEDDPAARHFYFGDPKATPGTMLTFLEYPSMDEGQIGVGVVHHFALRAGTLSELEAWHAHLTAHGIQCTQPLDRTYYSSIYFRDPDGNIVEIATDGPGMVIE